eukprot:549923_1
MAGLKFIQPTQGEDSNKSDKAVSTDDSGYDTDPNGKPDYRAWQFGMKTFYWDYYKDQEQEVYGDEMMNFGDKEEKNDGELIQQKDRYVIPKYKDLKDE